MPEVIPNGHSPRAGLPEWGRSPHEGRPARGEWPLGVTEGGSVFIIPSWFCFFIIPSYPLVFDNLDILELFLDDCGANGAAGRTAPRGERPEFRPSRFSGAYNAEGIGTSV